ncbi:MAG: hypothetical protein ACP5UZ_00600 [Thermoplasmata archaeon]
MNVKGVAWIGLKTGSRKKFDDARKTFSAILGKEPEAEGKDYLHFLLNDGSLLEIYMANIKKDSIVCGLSVDNIDASTEELKKIGVELIGGKECDNGNCWQHFALPDGTEWEIKEIR